MSETSEKIESLENEEKLDPYKIHLKIAQLQMVQGFTTFKVGDGEIKYTFMGSDPNVKKIYYNFEGRGLFDIDYSKIVREGNQEEDMVLLINKA